MSAIAGTTMEQAQTVAQKLSEPLVANVSDVVTNATNAVSNQQNLIILFNALMKKLGVLVKVRDEVTKVCSSISLSLLYYLNWSFHKKDPSLCEFGMAGAFHRDKGESISIIIVLFPDIYLCNQMVQAEQAWDQHILDLVMAVENTCSFMVSADELKNHAVLQNIIEQILKQTIECGYFIQEYTRCNFGGRWQVSLNEMAVWTEDRPERVLVHAVINVDDQIAAFSTVFTDLRKDFDSRLSLRTALILSQTVSSV
jgi:hypothetical protein